MLKRANILSYQYILILTLSIYSHYTKELVFNFACPYEDETWLVCDVISSDI